MKSQFIQLKSDEKLEVTREEYDANRSKLPRYIKEDNNWPLPICFAPFVCLDIAPDGKVSMCNHNIDAFDVLDEKNSILDIWNGSKLAKIREDMLNYTLDKNVCRHCVRQIAIRQYDEVFALFQFDYIIPESNSPKYPKQIIFHLNNTCNLACIMCHGGVSSKIRSVYEKKEPIKPVYSEKFYEDLEKILPSLQKIEFYGGEPFLVKENERIFELIKKTNSRGAIFANTNATYFSDKIKAYIEELNFNTIAVSMDAVDPDLHGKIRKGLKSDDYFANIEWLIDLRRRKDIAINLNVTEHRKNWYELPQIFLYAEEKRFRIHINTCVHPENVTLYTLPNDELSYILDYIALNRDTFKMNFPESFNLRSYNFLVNMIQGELENRSKEWQPIPTPPSPLCDGKIGVPVPGVTPFETPEKVMAEVMRIKKLNLKTSIYMLAKIRSKIGKLSLQDDSWKDLQV